MDRTTGCRLRGRNKPWLNNVGSMCKADKFKLRLEGWYRSLKQRFNASTHAVGRTCTPSTVLMTAILGSGTPRISTTNFLFVAGSCKHRSLFRNSYNCLEGIRMCEDGQWIIEGTTLCFIPHFTRNKLPCGPVQTVFYMMVGMDTSVGSFCTESHQALRHIPIIRA